MGGSITVKSKKFIKNLFIKKLIDRIETRNVELKLTNNTVKNLENIVPLIFKFEVDWLKYKNQKLMLDNIIKKSNLKRIKEIEKRKINTKKLNEKTCCSCSYKKRFTKS